MRQMAVGLAWAFLMTGCRTATRITEVPRVDLELSGGNRGYVVGHPPEMANLKTTRQTVQTDVEIPSFYKPKRSGAPVGLEDVAPPETKMGAQGAGESVGAAPKRYDTYVVQKGESLWTIAAKPEVYGKATQWRRIFDANRDLLKSPDRVRAGMKLKIPRGDERGISSAAPEEEGTTYKK